MKRALLTALAVSGLALSATTASAAVTFDPANGTGFAGKGDVQQALGYNNKQLQDNAGSLQFAYKGTEVTEVSWTCTNSNNEKLQERQRTTTTSITGVVNSVARERNQITGFNLSGYNDPITSSTTEGNRLNSCPDGPWSLTTPAGDPEVISSTGGLYANDVFLP